MQFDEKDRRIFKYNDGKKDKYIDPMVVEVALLEQFQAEDIQTVMKNLSDETIPDIITLPLSIKFAKAIAKVFNLELVNEDTGEGLTVMEVIEVWSQFNDFLSGVKKNTETGPLLSQPMAFPQGSK